MKNKIILCVLFLLANVHLHAQFIKEKSIEASIGIGYNSPNDDVDMNGSGFFLQGEYILKIASWIDVRPYAGLILVESESEPIEPNNIVYKTTSNAFLIGGKTRINAPIPYFSPYFEIGIGASIGSFETFTPFTNIKKEGIAMHIPLSIGVALGRKHNFDLGFTYYSHPNLKQVCGAAAIGITFPLETKKK
ncbi:hypothetical protein M0M57_15525 [Flavobacterium azooxidireducens]|uniref:Outer membrane protein beta-barrel domain-containing protein n=1 Tax=Flavobacterium azooxidireducens TaxID=1871076 RepID=A0ABY4KFE1_9FLAO|nr:hypothetical protein [Flavobacterium azooxidireducens]UPQ79016.1 hypothetical protein M0M57_15525 [Flavobacterium azooxidireducens]